MHRTFSALLLLFLALPLSAKSLSWSAFDVQARLDADGNLHVRERQEILFDGDWNGGERTFDLRTGQSLRVESLARIDASGQAHPMTNGDLSRVDQWRLMSGNVLRWRSRLPDDPPFDHARMTYRIDYVLHGVLRGESGTFRFAHDFAFPDRDGDIRNFTLRFEVDPVWRGLDAPVTRRIESIPPHQGVLVRANLARADGSVPEGVLQPMPRTEGILIGVVFLLLLGGIVLWWIRGERKAGRFGLLDAPGSPDPEWLKAHLLSLRPEVASAALFGKVGPHAVAAFLARMTQEGSISTEVKPKGRRPVLHMRLEKERETLEPVERKLVQALFKKRQETDTERIRKAYSKSGFDPAAIIAPAIDSQLDRLPGWSETRGPVRWKLGVLLLLAGLAAVIFAAVTGNQDDVGVAVGTVVLGLPCAIGALVTAALSRRTIIRFPLRIVVLGLFLAPFLSIIPGYAFRADRYLFHPAALIAACVWVLALSKLAFDLMATDEAAERLAFRRRLARARVLLRTELTTAEPSLRDEWYPWLLGLGLGRNVDRWFRSFAAVADSGDSVRAQTYGSSGMTSGGTGVHSFTGGGGAFGGGGASGGWAVAAGTIASGVTAAASSGSGSSGGGGGGGGISGGGGGGGW